MEQEFGQYVKTLLYKHKRLSIADLGSFELKQAPAFLDQVQTQIAAPAMEVSFNESLLLDDGILLEYISQQKKWNTKQSQEWLTAQVNKIQDLLEKRQIVEVKGVGRFFKNFEQQLKFVAENNNFNTHSYGLKTLNAQAVNHSILDRKTNYTSNASTIKQTNPTPAKKAAPSWLRQNLWWLALLVVLTTALFTYFLLPNAKPAEPIVNVPEERLNASPSKEVEEQPAVLDPEEQHSDPVQEESPELTEEQSVLPPQEHTAIIAVGLFADQKNVQKLLEKLSKLGYSPVAQDENGKTRVGVSIRYEEEEELDELLREVQQKQERSAFIMYKNGVRVE